MRPREISCIALLWQKMPVRLAPLRRSPDWLYRACSRRVKGSWRGLSYSLLMCGVGCHNQVRQFPEDLAKVRYVDSQRNFDPLRTAATNPPKLPGPQTVALTPAAPSTAPQNWLNRPFARPDALLSVGAVDPQGRWVLFCQAEGDASSQATLEKQLLKQSSFLRDAFKPYFARFNSGTASVTALLAASPDGRYVVLHSQDNGPELLDTETGQSESLNSIELDIRADVLTGDLRSVAFSGDSSKLALLVHEKQPRVIVKDLQTKQESEIVPVGNKVWRIAFDASGQYIVLKEVLEDTNHNGKMDWPVPMRSLIESRCLAPVPAYAAFTATGDSAQTSIASVTGGNARLQPGFITALGPKAIVKLPNGALSAIEGSRSRIISSPDCDAQIIAIAPAYGRIVVGCRDSNGRSKVELESLLTVQKLDLDVPTVSTDWITPESEPYTVIYSGPHTYLIDLAGSKVIQLEDKDQVLAQGKSGILLRRGTLVVLFHPSNGTCETMLEDVRPGTRIIPGKATTLVGSTVINSDQGRVQGRLASPVLALAANGCAIVSGHSPSAGQFARGPLTWSCPSL